MTTAVLNTKKQFSDKNIKKTPKKPLGFSVWGIPNFFNMEIQTFQKKVG